MRICSRARADELAARQNQEGGPVDVVAAVRAAEWDIWAAWLLGEDPAPAIDLLPIGQRPAWGEWREAWHRRARRLSEGRRHALDRWHWVSGAATARKVSEGSALYVVSRGRLRLRIELDLGLSAISGRGGTPAGLVFARNIQPSRPCSHPRSCGCPVAFEPVTLGRDVPSPRGMRRRWWPRDAEIACPDWRTTALGLEEGEQL